jgi:hypothetical protein
MECGDAALYAPGFFRVEILVRLGKKRLDSFSIPAVYRNSDACGEPRNLLVLRHDCANAIGDALRFGVLRFGQNESELVSAVARGGIDGAAMNAQDGGEAAERAAANQMAKAVVNFFQAVEIEEQNGEGPAGAIGALGLVLENVEKPAVVGEAGERVADSKVADLFEESSVIEERATEGESVTADGKDLCEHKRRVEKALGLAGGDLRSEVHPGCGVDGAVEGTVLGIKTAAIPNYGGEKDYAWQQLVGAGHERARMAGCFRWKASKGGSYHIRETDHREQGAGYLRFGVARTGDKSLNEQRDKEQKGQEHPAEPPGDRSPVRPRGRILQELKKENTGGRQDRARKQISAPENQRDTILGALETDESERGENERQQGGDDLKIALKNRVGFEGERAEPVGNEEREQDAQDMPQDNLGGTTTGHTWFPVHTDGPRLGRGATQLDYVGKASVADKVREL